MRSGWEAIPAVVGVFRAGALPYYAERGAIDFLGKCDPHIARLLPDLSARVAWYRMKSVPGHNKYDLEYSIKTRHLTMVKRFVWGQQDLRDWAVEHYVEVEYRGVGLYLLKGSPAVRWDRIGLP